VSAIAHTCIGVSDLNRALGFYRDAIGLEVARRTEMPTGAILVLLKPPAGQEVIELFWSAGNQSPAAASGPGKVSTAPVGLRHVAFWVEDVRRVVGELEGLGVAITRRPPGPGQAGNLIAFVKDPDGTDVELMQQ
jgi:lactoylglutathione lyase